MSRSLTANIVPCLEDAEANNIEAAEAMRFSLNDLHVDIVNEDKERLTS